MNFLERLHTLISKEGRAVKFGDLTNETNNPLVCLAVGGLNYTANVLSDKRGTEYRGVVVKIYSEDYMEGFNLLEEIKAEIKAAQKSATVIFHVKDIEAKLTEDKTKYVFKSIYKIIN